MLTILRILKNDKKNLHNRNTDKFNYKKEYQYGRLVQDGGVEGNAHISCESTKITTCYRKTTDRRTLELTKKKDARVQRQRRSYNKTVGGVQSR